MENTHDFIIHLSCSRDVEEFVRLSAAQPFPIRLTDGVHTINGKSFMGMFSLALTGPLRVIPDCSPDELEEYRFHAERLLRR